ncbi:hypothetical protein [Rouxiella sp. WC2420]|uniref:Flagellin n=1 Tax=Rouxiella sp. WC2420 TaxID=3234145 RepID=A0AB39VSB5_9GAMM
MMQVGITSTKSSGLAAPLAQARATTPSRAVGKLLAESAAQLGDFPDPPLISSRPVRYNIELNHQITAVQQADDFLARAENQIVELRHAIKSGPHAAIKKQAGELSTLLDARLVLSGHRVDRQLNVTLVGQPQTDFTLPAADTLLSSQQPETLVFAIADARHQLAAVRLPQDAGPHQSLRLLGQCLGRLGVRVSQSAEQPLNFSADEQFAARICQHLTVRGEGGRFPGEQFTPVMLVAGHQLLDSVNNIISKPVKAAAMMDELHRTLQHISEQRQQLSQNREQIRAQFQSMATFKQAGSAQKAAAQIGNKLANAANNFATLSQALSGQANARSAMVKNVLRVTN